MSDFEQAKDFIDKKEAFADLLELFIEDPEKRDELHALLRTLKDDEEFKSKELFNNIIKEFELHGDELSRKELKQRVLLIRSYLD